MLYSDETHDLVMSRFKTQELYMYYPRIVRPMVAEAQPERQPWTTSIPQPSHPVALLQKQCILYMVALDQYKLCIGSLANPANITWQSVSHVVWQGPGHVPW